MTFLPLEAIWADDRLDLTRLRSRSELLQGYSRFRDGDVLCPKVAPTFQAGRSALVAATASKVGAATTEVFVLRPRSGLEARFVRYVLLSTPFLSEGVTRFQGVAGLQRVPPDFVAGFPVHTADGEEQRRIADFLDDQVARLDTAARVALQAQKRLFERFASWLDDRLGTAAGTALLSTLTDPRRPIQYGIVLPGPHVPGGVPIVKGGDVAAHRLHPDLLSCTSPEIESRYPRSRLRFGDLLIAIRGSVGELAAVPESLTGANITQDAARIAPRGCNATWLRWVMQTPTVQSRIAQRVTGATIRGINIADLRRVAVPVPSTEEQARLAQVADAQARSQASGERELLNLIGLLEERKRALITACVAGEFDVATASSRAAGAALAGVG